MLFIFFNSMKNYTQSFQNTLDEQMICFSKYSIQSQKEVVLGDVQSNIMNFGYQYLFEYLEWTHENDV